MNLRGITEILIADYMANLANIAVLGGSTKSANGVILEAATVAERWSRRKSMTSEINPKELLDAAVSEHLAVVRELARQQDVIEAIALTMTAAILGGGKILWCGNGGSAADCQHLAADIVGRFRRERRALSSIALTTDSSILTAVANDYGYQCVFSRQVEALAQIGDVLVGISTSGNSQNVIMALEQARSMGVTTVALTGAGGGKMGAIADHILTVPSTETARIQEAHILVGHVLCDWVELRWAQTQQANHGRDKDLSGLDAG